MQAKGNTEGEWMRTFGDNQFQHVIPHRAATKPKDKNGMQKEGSCV
jgi:hypothetical protein